MESLGLARVYIKRPEDFPAVRTVCEQRLGELPTIYAIGDVCRPELLVEIEGIAFSSKVPAAIPPPVPLIRCDSRTGLLIRRTANDRLAPLAGLAKLGGSGQPKPEPVGDDR
jgi:hypothetical protein